MICGKTIYATSRDAIEAIKATFRKFPDRASLVEPSKAYFCDDCQGYHLYSERKNKKKKQIVSQKTDNELDSTHPNQKQNDRNLKTLIIHEARKFKVK